MIERCKQQLKIHQAKNGTGRPSRGRSSRYRLSVGTDRRGVAADGRLLRPSELSVDGRVLVLGIGRDASREGLVIGRSREGSFSRGSEVSRNAFVAAFVTGAQPLPAHRLSVRAEARNRPLCLAGLVAQCGRGKAGFPGECGQRRAKR